MSALKCTHCGLVNFATETHCQRCGRPLIQNAPDVAGSSPKGAVLEDGYVLPPPPSVGMAGEGIWRDNSKLVMSKGAVLPDRCVKCNEPAYGVRLKRKLSWHHPAIYILIFVALLIYLIVALVVRKTATVELGLCQAHAARRRKRILITWLLILLGIAGFIASMVLNDGTYALIGVVLFIAGIIFGIAAIRVVVPAKIDDRFVWLKGVSKDYLDQLPQWPMAPGLMRC